MCVCVCSTILQGSHKEEVEINMWNNLCCIFPRIQLHLSGMDSDVGPFRRETGVEAEVCVCDLDSFRSMSVCMCCFHGILLHSTL